MLEQFQKYSAKTARRLSLPDVSLWAAQGRRSTVTRLRSRSQFVEATYDIYTYERNVHLKECPTIALQVPMMRLPS